MLIKIFKGKRGCQHSSVTRLDTTDLSVRVGEQATYLDRPGAETDGDVDPASVDLGAHRIASLVGDDVDITSAQHVDPLHRGKRLTVIQSGGLAINIQRRLPKADRDRVLA